MREDYEMFHLSDGENIVRILPPTWKNPSHYGVDISTHFIEGKIYFCNKGKCCIEGEYTARKVLTWVVHEGKLKLWIMPRTVDKMVLNRIISSKRWAECIHKDYSLVIYKSGIRIQTTFRVDNLIKTKENKTTKEILDFIVRKPLPSIVQDFYYDNFINVVKKVLKNESLL